MWWKLGLIIILALGCLPVGGVTHAQDDLSVTIESYSHGLRLHLPADWEVNMTDNSFWLANAPDLADDFSSPESGQMKMWLDRNYAEQPSAVEYATYIAQIAFRDEYTVEEITIGDFAAAEVRFSDDFYDHWFFVIELDDATNDMLTGEVLSVVNEMDSFTDVVTAILTNIETFIPELPELGATVHNSDLGFSVDVPIGWSVIANEHLVNISSLDDFSSTQSTFDIEIRWLPMEDELAEGGIASDASLVEVLQYYAVNRTYGPTNEQADSATPIEFGGQEAAIIETSNHTLIAFSLADGRPFVGDFSTISFSTTMLQHYQPLLEAMFQSVRPLDTLTTYSANGLASEEPFALEIGYPAEWTLDDSDPAFLVLVNDPAILESEELGSGALEIWITHTETLITNLEASNFDFDLFGAEAIAEEMLRALYLETGDETLDGVSSAEYFDMDQYRSAARTYSAELDETITFAIDLDNGEYLVIVAIAPTGELAGHLPTVWSLVYSLDIPETE